jgi:L-seryl-tRNA(Ser) seleniumtransferase
VLLGRKDLIDAALANTSPWEGAVCRPMKVGKEEIIGCLAAVEAWFGMDFNLLSKQWATRVDRIATLVGTVPGVETKIYTPDTNQYPTLVVSWNESAWGYTTADCARDLLDGSPSIAVLTDDNPSDVLSRKIMQSKSSKGSQPNKLQIVSMTLKPGEEIIVGKRLRQLLAAASSKAKS